MSLLTFLTRFCIALFTWSAFVDRIINLHELALDYPLLFFNHVPLCVPQLHLLEVICLSLFQQFLREHLIVFDGLIEFLVVQFNLSIVHFLNRLRCIFAAVMHEIPLVSIFWNFGHSTRCFVDGVGLDISYSFFNSAFSLRINYFVEVLLYTFTQINHPNFVAFVSWTFPAARVGSWLPLDIGHWVWVFKHLLRHHLSQMLFLWYFQLCASVKMMFVFW